MTDHLADARACLSRVDQAAAHFSGATWLTATWLTATCEHILAHLEAQKAPQQPATAPPAAQQGERGHRDGGEAVQAAMAVLRDEGADSEGGWHSWRCFDRERYPEPCDCTEQVARAAIAAAEPHIRAKIAAEARDALAEAWDEGFRKGDAYAFHGGAYPADPNPYRQEQP